LIEKKKAENILNKLKSTGGSFSEIFLQKKISGSLKLDDGKIENATNGYDLGAGLRLCFKDSTFYAYVDSINYDKLINAAEVLSAAVSSVSSHAVLDLRNLSHDFRSSVLVHPSMVEPSVKRDILFDVDKISRDYNKAIMQVSTSLSYSEEDIFIANSDGIFTEEHLVKNILSISVIASKDKNIRTGYKSMAKTCGFEMFDDKAYEKPTLEASSTAVKMLEAINAPSGQLPVVIGPAFGGVIFHEACGHGLEADAIIKDASVYKDKIGKKIANEIVNAIDDSSMPSHFGSYKFDGEGCPSRKNILIEDGILVNYIFDYKTAKKLKSSQTGNGRRNSYRDIPYPRMSNTYIDIGKQKPESMIKSVDKGIYAKEFAGGQVDPATGDFVFGISEGYMIENGTITFPIKGATLIGNGPEILHRIEAIGDDLGFAPGFCGKNGQSIANEVGQPTILVSNITVGGTSL
jgi:TldD protein